MLHTFRDNDVKFLTGSCISWHKKAAGRERNQK